MSDDKTKIIEEYLGVDPKYFVFDGTNLKLDVSQMAVDGIEVPSDGVRVWERGELYQEHLAEGKIALNP